MGPFDIYLRQHICVAPNTEIAKSLEICTARTLDADNGEPIFELGAKRFETLACEFSINPFYGDCKEPSHAIVLYYRPDKEKP